MAINTDPEDFLPGLLDFQQWAALQRKKGLISFPGNGSMILGSELAADFCLGIIDDRVFLGVSTQEYRWLSKFPLSHASMYRGKSVFYLVNDSILMEEANIPSFAIGVEVAGTEKLKAMEMLGEIDLRQIHRNDKGVIGDISGDPIALSLFIMDDDQPVLDDVEAFKGKYRKTNTARFRA